jgi:hypothetical protein
MSFQTALLYSPHQTFTVPSTDDVAHTTWGGGEAAPAKATAVMRTGPCGLSICSKHIQQALQQAQKPVAIHK